MCDHLQRSNRLTTTPPPDTGRDTYKEQAGGMLSKTAEITRVVGGAGGAVETLNSTSEVMAWFPTQPHLCTIKNLVWFHLNTGIVSLF